ncbi:hypothetical protein PRUPE_1G326300 [Prunus persica]|uniref:Uncharacterized protein n=1 Tax=Prunus persica TaxID=3760 RepID=A0A251R6R3_PRUPE|nr:hypothetical protein PRUPE_1G326300 [Prunus persica]
MKPNWVPREKKKRTTCSHSQVQNENDCPLMTNNQSSKMVPGRVCHLCKCIKLATHSFSSFINNVKRDVVATIVYELRPNPSDHKTKAKGGGLSHVE